jgi:hypothetical protein
MGGGRRPEARVGPVPSGMRGSSREREGCGGALARAVHLRRVHNSRLWLSEPDRTDTGFVSYIYKLSTLPYHAGIQLLPMTLQQAKAAQPARARPDTRAPSRFLPMPLRFWHAHAACARVPPAPSPSAFGVSFLAAPNVTSIGREVGGGRCLLVFVNVSLVLTT